VLNSQLRKFEQFSRRAENFSISLSFLQNFTLTDDSVFFLTFFGRNSISQKYFVLQTNKKKFYMWL